MLNFVIDKDIPFIKGVFEPYARVVYLKGAEIDNSCLRHADALIVRTRTRCDAALLSDTRVRFIASATIGTDHVDLQYCNSHGIHFENAAGCNSSAVMQYVYTALFALVHKDSRILDDSARQGKRPVIGVIGVGNVGSKVAALGEYLGFDVLRNDPPREALQERALAEGRLSANEATSYCRLGFLLRNSDIVTMHVPLLDTTRGMAGSTFFSSMKPGAVFVNTSRGEAVDETALLASRRKLSGLIIDVWNNEPAINTALLGAADIATPHIAGYSVEGKANGTLMVVRAAARYFGIGELENYEIPKEMYDKSLTPVLDLKGKGAGQIFKELYEIFPIFNLDNLLRDNVSDFEHIRSNYKLRREFHVYQQR